jgi:hypothetical protein
VGEVGDVEVLAVSEVVVPATVATEVSMVIAVVVVGGMLSNGSSTSHASVYTPTTNSWRNLPSMPTPRNGLGAVVVGSRGTLVLAMGGYDSTRTPGADGHVDVVEAIDLADDVPKWVTMPPMLTPRSGFGVTVGSNGALVYVAGGATVGHVPLRLVEVFDVDLRKWSALAPMVRARTYLGLALVTDSLGAFRARVRAHSHTARMLPSDRRGRASTNSRRSAQDETAAELREMQESLSSSYYGDSHVAIDSLPTDTNEAHTTMLLVPPPPSPPPPPLLLLLLAFGGTNCSTTVIVNGTSRCVSMPTTEAMIVAAHNSTTFASPRPPRPSTPPGTKTADGDSRSSSLSSLSWAILPGSSLPLPVHAGAVVSVAMLNGSSPCVIGGETLSNVDTAAVQCWVAA